MLLTIDPSLLVKGAERAPLTGVRRSPTLAEAVPSSSLSACSDDQWSFNSGYVSASGSSSSKGYGDDQLNAHTAGSELGRAAFDGYDVEKDLVDDFEQRKRSLGFTLPMPPSASPRASRPELGVRMASVNGPKMGGIPITLNRVPSHGQAGSSTSNMQRSQPTTTNATTASSSSHDRQPSVNGSTLPTSSTLGRKRKKKYSRSRLGCLTCRQRKVRCDETKPTCEKCSDLERVCVWPDNPGAPRKRQSVGKADSTTHGSNSGDDGGSDDDEDEEAEQAGPSGSQMGNTDGQWQPTYPQGIDNIIGFASNSVRIQSAQARTDLMQRTGNSHGNLSQLITLSPTTSAPRMSATPMFSQPSLPNEIDTDDMINQFLMNGSTFMSPGDLLGNFDTSMNDQAQPAPMPINGVTSFSPPKPPTIITIPSNGTLPQINAVKAPTNLSLTRSALVRRRNATRTPPDASNTFALQAGMAGFQLNSQMMPDPFFHAFPLASHRRLFHHFLNNTSSIVVALGLRDRSKNPLLAVSLPMITLDNENPARAALRMAVLSLGAVHLYHVHKTASENALADNKSTDVQVHKAQAEEMMDEARKTKKQALGQMMLSLIKDQEQHIDILLATCSTIKTRDVLFGDLAWKDNVDFAIRLIYKQGGPAAVIAADPGNFVRRFFVESLATTDVFSTFSTGQEPMLLGPWAPWWFDCERYNQTSQQWEAYERQYGISRGMTELVARCRACIYRASSLGADGEPLMGGISEAIETEARSLIEELAIFAFAQHDVPRQTRVSYGDSAYRYTMQICLYTEVLGKATTDPDVQTSVKCVLELCSEISQDPVILVWPLLSASANAVGKEDRQWAKDLFRTFRGDHCQDLVIAEELLDEQWRRMDRGGKLTPWYRLMKEMGKQVMLI